MNWRSLLPVTGVAAGMLAACPFRPQPPQQEKSRIPLSLGSHAKEHPAPSNSSAPGDFAAVDRLWETGGKLGLYAALEGIPPATLAEWLDKLMPPDMGLGVARQKRREMRQAIGERLAASDPVRLASRVQKIDRRESDSLVLNATRGLMAAGTPESASALEKLKKRFPEAARKELDLIAEKDPAAAFDRMQKQEPCRYLPPKVAAWIALDPAKAAAFANAHPDLWHIAPPGAVERATAAGEGNVEAFAALCLKDAAGENFQTLVQTHPEAVEEVAGKFAEKPAMCAALWSALAETDPAKAAALLASPAFAGALKEKALRNTRVLADWYVLDPQGALAWMKGQPPEVTAVVLPSAGKLVDDLTSAEWLALASHFPAKPDDNGELVAQAVAKLPDPEALTAWCNTLPEDSRRSMMEQLTRTLSEKDLTKATAMALAAEDGPQRDRLFESVLGTAIFNKSTSEALAWADGLPAELRTSTITSLLQRQILNGSPPEKVEELSRFALERINGEPPETLSKWNGLANDAAGGLVLRDKAACESFLSSLPASMQGSAIEQVTANSCGNLFFPDKIDDTLNWIAGIKDTAIRQALAKSICDQLAKGGLTPAANQRVRETLTPFTR